MATIFRSKWFIAIAIAAALVGLYALVGYKLAPRIVRNQAIDFVRETYGRELAIGQVRIDPFKLQLEIDDVALPDADGGVMLGFRRLLVDLEAASLWERAFVFRDIAVEAPVVNAVVRPDGSANLADLAPKANAPPPEPESGGAPNVWVQSFEVKDGLIDFSDHARAQPFQWTFKPVTFSLRDFRTTPQGGRFHLTAQGEAGASFDWKGRLELAPAVASEGDLTIQGVRLPIVAEALGDTLPFAVTSGRMNIAGRYQVRLGKEIELKLRLPSIELAELNVRAQGADSDWVRIPSIVLTDTAVAIPEQTVTLARLAVESPAVQAWLAPDGSINLTDLFKARPAAAAPVEPSGQKPAAPQVKLAKAEGRISERPWQVAVANVDVTGGSIDLEDRKIAPGTKFAIAPLNVHVQSASLDLSKPLPIQADAVVNGHAPVKAEGTLTPDPLAANLTVSVVDARMTILQPYVLPLADLTIKDGVAAMNGRLQLAPADAPGPQIRFAGDLSIEHFKSVDNVLHDDLVNFQRVEVQKLRYEMAPDSVSIDRILVDRPFARVILSPERIVNIKAVLDPKGTAAELQARRAEEAALAKMSKAERKQYEKEREAAAQRAADARVAAEGGTAETTLPPLPAEKLPIRIREVRVTDGTMDFTDLYVRPNFAAKIQRLRGSVTGLSSDPTSHARVDFDGDVGEFSPVKISGEIQPFSFERYTDIDLKFENISLPIFNPYSGEFAGYNIAKGKLTTDLHYLIVNRKLDAQHKIHIDQLEWGEASPNKGEATLPVRFATALLKDRHGVIDLDVPVTGTIGDPQFRVWPIVWQIIKNLVVKAVTAPFALLGALFEGAEKAQFVDFLPGQSTLDATASGNLAALARSLAEKPNIKLDVPIGVVPEIDRPALAEIAYQQALATAVAGVAPQKQAAPAEAESFDALKGRQKIAALEALLKAQTGSVPQVPEPPAPPEGASRKEKKQLENTAAIEFLEREARSHITVPDLALEELGEHRADAVQRALLAGGQLDPSRLFPIKNGKVSAHDGKVRLQLELK